MVYRRSTLRPRRSITKKRSYRKTYANPSNKLARFNYSKKRYYHNRKLTTSINQFAENHKLQCFRQNEVPPIPIQLGALAQYRLFCFGSIPSTWDPSAIDIAGISITQGTSEGQRAGNYVYLKSSTISLNIDTNITTDADVSPPIQFRIVVFKQRRGNMPAGISYNPATSLFLTELGNTFGYTTSGVNGSDLMMQPLNRRDYIIHTDKKCILSSPYGAKTGYTGNYPTIKDMRIKLPFYKKTHYDNASALPDDIDFHYGIAIFARSQQKDVAASQFEVNLRGSTSFTDL